MSARAAIVIQARMGSERLPGKSLAPIAGRSLLARVVERLQVQQELPVVVATTTLLEDDLLCEEADRLGVAVVRGSADDVLGRYAFAASLLGVPAIVRATADNPAVDLDAPLRTLEILLRSGADYVVDYGLPVGATVEAMTLGALVRAAALATDPYDREHVTPFVKRDGRSRAVDALAPTALRRPDLRFTVDTLEDLDAMRRVYHEAGPSESPWPLEALIAAADRVRARAALDEPTGVDAR
jgi:spore coat polysaccharide biosynthesis protein SpsF